ncbi:MAG: S8 family serine peptidase [Candidatus Sericytochromatia bacterium]|nr:S8 family serine peptidase [Candidatus Tanganyikabacteria bacterium]
MRKAMGLLLVAATVGCGQQVVGSVATATRSASVDVTAQAAREIVVMVDPAAAAQASRTVKAMGAAVTRTFRLKSEVQVVRIPDGVDRDLFLARLRQQPGVKSAVLQRVYRAIPVVQEAELAREVGALISINDPSFSKQWAYGRTGTPANWEGIDASGTLVAVADTGVDAAHPDLGGRVRSGQNFAGGTGTGDKVGHGTHCAGIIGATGNNSQGIAGIVWNAPILAIKVLGDNGSGTTEGVAQGMKSAADAGAKVLNMSLGSDTTEIDPVMHDALEYCLAKGTIVICAAGNNGRFVGSPANDPLAIAVSSTSDGMFGGEKISGFSSRGKQVWVSAPGGGIMSTLPTTGSQMGTTYGKASGTSMACPFVAGTATMMRAAHPDWSVAQVRDALKASTDDLGTPGFDELYGHGRVNLAKASR